MSSGRRDLDDNYYIGLVIVALCIGTATEAVWGWAVFGGGLLVTALADRLWR